MLNELKSRAQSYGRSTQDLAKLTCEVLQARSCTPQQMTIVCDALDRHLRSGVEFTNPTTCVSMLRASIVAHS